MYRYILWDLDGTLLPMDQDAFTRGYFGLLAKKLAPHGYDPKQLVSQIWAGTAAMVKNDGTKTNETAFWDCFASFFEKDVREDMPLFDEFYARDFDGAKAFCGYQPLAAQLIHEVKAAGIRVVLATNPIFPAVATQKRIAWAGLKPEEFELYTTYENSCHCKPNPDYFRDILKQLGAKPEECLMVGNDAREDVAALEAGLRVYLVTDCLINTEGKDLTGIPHGSFEDLRTWLQLS